MPGLDELFGRPVVIDKAAFEQPTTPETIAKLDRIIELLELLEQRTRPPVVLLAQGGSEPICTCNQRPYWPNSVTVWWCPVHGMK